MRGRGHALFDFIIDKKKTYVAELQLGVATDTQDATGAVTDERPVDVTRQTCAPCCPASSATYCKRRPCTRPSSAAASGLYELARRGESIEVAPRACRGGRRAPSCVPGRGALPSGGGLRQGRLHRTLCHDIGADTGAAAAIWLRSHARAPACSRWKNALTLEDVEALGVEGLEAQSSAHGRGHRPPARRARGCAALPRCALRQPLRPAWLDAPAPQAPAVRVYVGKEFAGVGTPCEDGSVRFRAMLLK